MQPCAAKRETYIHYYWNQVKPFCLKRSWLQGSATTNESKFPLVHNHASRDHRSLGLFFFSWKPERVDICFVKDFLLCNSESHWLGNYCRVPNAFLSPSAEVNETPKSCSHNGWVWMLRFKEWFNILFFVYRPETKVFICLIIIVQVLFSLKLGLFLRKYLFSSYMSF